MMFRVFTILTAQHPNVTTPVMEARKRERVISVESNESMPNDSRLPDRRPSRLESIALELGHGITRAVASTATHIERELHDFGDLLRATLFWHSELNVNFFFSPQFFREDTLHEEGGVDANNHTDGSAAQGDALAAL